MITRRTLIADLARFGALAALPGGLAFAQDAPLRAVPLADGLLAVLGPGANVLVAESEEGLILVDGGEASWSPGLLALCGERFPGRPLRALVNTHWHPEQVGSNLAAAEAGAELIAHDNTRLWLSKEVRQRWSGRTYAPLPGKARPKTVLHDSGSMKIGGRALDLGYVLHAHTDGDLYVHLPEENILFTGGFVRNDAWPVVDWWTGGWSGGMLNAFAIVLAACSEDTVIVPSSGPLMSYADLREQEAMYLSILERVHGAFVRSLGPDEAVAEKPAAGFKPEWGSADLFVRTAFESIHGHLRGGVGTWLPRIP